MKFIIEKGDKFRCKKDVRMINDFGEYEEVAYVKGRSYHSEKERCITDELGFKNHFWDELDEFVKYFIYI